MGFLPDMTVGTALVLGCNGDGPGLARLLAGGGISVSLYEPDPDVAERLRHMLARSGAPEVSVQAQLPDLGADIVVDALDDDPAERKSLYQSLAPLMPNALFIVPWDPGSTPPEVPVTLQHRQIGFRVRPPIGFRRLAEVVVAPQTRPGIRDAMSELASSLNLITLDVAAARPSTADRLHARLCASGDELLMQGAIVDEVDTALKAVGFDLGLFEAEDLIGLDAFRSRRRFAGAPLTPIADRMVEDGRLGKAVGVGWYRYPGGGGAVIDPLVEDLVREEAWFARITQREIAAEEVIATILRDLKQESKSLLSDGTAQSIDEINLVAEHGLGAPAGFIELSTPAVNR